MIYYFDEASIVFSLLSNAVCCSAVSVGGDPVADWTAVCRASCINFVTDKTFDGRVTGPDNASSVLSLVISVVMDVFKYSSDD